MSMEASNTNGRKVGLLGIPLGFGAAQTGSELGVSAMRVSKTRGKHLGENIAELGYEVSDVGDVDVVRPGYVAEESENPKYLGEMLASMANIDLALGDLLRDGKLPVILGGDHSIAIGTFSTLASHYRDLGTEIGLIWFDAHA